MIMTDEPGYVGWFGEEAARTCIVTQRECCYVSVQVCVAVRCVASKKVGDVAENGEGLGRNRKLSA
jgi:hypothetical protein